MGGRREFGGEAEADDIKDHRVSFHLYNSNSLKRRLRAAGFPHGADAGLGQAPYACGGQWRALGWSWPLAEPRATLTQPTEPQACSVGEEQTSLYPQGTLAGLNAQQI